MPSRKTAILNAIKELKTKSMPKGDKIKAKQIAIAMLIKGGKK